MGSSLGMPNTEVELVWTNHLTPTRAAASATMRDPSTLTSLYFRPALVWATSAAL
jgi:hypothetical protein